MGITQPCPNTLEVRKELADAQQHLYENGHLYTVISKLTDVMENMIDIIDKNENDKLVR